MHRYRVFGYDDAPLANNSESLIAAYKTPEEAIAYARADNLATCVIDWETDEVLWEWAETKSKTEHVTVWRRGDTLRVDFG